MAMERVKNPQRLLLIGPSNIGDALLASEALQRLRAAYPEGHLTLLVGERAQQLYKGDPRIQTLVNLDAYDGFSGRLRLLLEIISFMPRVIVDLRHTLYPMVLKPARAWRYLFNPPPSVVHTRDRHLWKLARHAPEASGVEVSAKDALWYSERDREQVDALWQRWGIRKGKPVVVICPGARSHIKRWRAEGFAAVADRLIKERGAQVIFSGEPLEREIVEDVRARMAHPSHTAVGLITIRQLALVMQRADAVLTNDSASLHMASAVNAPTVALFGPTDDKLYGPRADIRITLRRRLFCAPCKAASCRFSHECMRFLTADEVYGALMVILSGGGYDESVR